jgi:hypothetical protein
MAISLGAFITGLRRPSTDPPHVIVFTYRQKGKHVDIVGMNEPSQKWHSLSGNLGAGQRPTRNSSSRSSSAVTSNRSVQSWNR